jgi:cytochrome c oxidase cbb3-type subunit 4
MDVNELRTGLLVICFFIYLGIVWWAYSKRNSQRHETAANLPFADDPTTGLPSVTADPYQEKING